VASVFVIEKLSVVEVCRIGFSARSARLRFLCRGYDSRTPEEAHEGHRQDNSESLERRALESSERARDEIESPACRGEAPTRITTTPKNPTSANTMGIAISRENATLHKTSSGGPGQCAQPLPGSHSCHEELQKGRCTLVVIDLTLSRSRSPDNGRSRDAKFAAGNIPSISAPACAHVQNRCSQVPPDCRMRRGSPAWAFNRYARNLDRIMAREEAHCMARALPPD
jgi:hypothetical protein